MRKVDTWLESTREYALKSRDKFKCEVLCTEEYVMNQVKTNAYHLLFNAEDKPT